MGENASGIMTKGWVGLLGGGRCAYVIKVAIYGYFAISSIPIVLADETKQCIVNAAAAVKANILWQHDLDSLVFLDQFHGSIATIPKLASRLVVRHILGHLSRNWVNDVWGVDNDNTALLFANVG